MAGAILQWIKQNNYSWRGYLRGIPYLVILTCDFKKFTLQIPGCYSGSNSIKNVLCGSYEEAVHLAEKLLLPEE